MFGFPKQQHKTFGKNFLKTVIFQVSFDENKECESKKPDIVELFKKNFPHVNKNLTQGFQISFSKDQTPILQPHVDSTGLELRSTDGQKVVSINNQTFSYTISGKAYKDYASLKKDISLITSFFSKCGIKTLNKVAIRKINIIEFEKKGNACDMLEMIMAPELLTNLSYLPNSEIVNQNIHSISYNTEEHRLNFKYGLNNPNIANNNFGQIVIDIDMINKASTKVPQVFNVADAINDEIFNVFSWSVSENFLNLIDE